MIAEMVHDPYKRKSKLAEPTVCPTCNAVYEKGRWQWAESRPYRARMQTCPACYRTRQSYPAGVITLRGQFSLTHTNELIQLMRHHEQRENLEHPLHRIMGIEEHADGIVIKTTDIHLPRRIAEALHHGYKGHLVVQYDRKGYFARVNWTREESLSGYKIQRR